MMQILFHNAKAQLTCSTKSHMTVEKISQTSNIFRVGIKGSSFVIYEFISWSSKLKIC